VQGLLSEADKALAQQGLNAAAVVDATKSASEAAGSAVSAAQPTINQAVSFLTTTDPLLLGEYALGLLGVYYLVRFADRQTHVPYLCRLLVLRCRVQFCGGFSRHIAFACCASGAVWAAGFGVLKGRGSL
jgi:hypothetical protein